MLEILTSTLEILKFVERNIILSKSLKRNQKPSPAAGINTTLVSTVEFIIQESVNLKNIRNYGSFFKQCQSLFVDGIYYYNCDFLNRSVTFSIKLPLKWWICTLYTRIVVNIAHFSFALFIFSVSVISDYKCICSTLLLQTSDYECVYMTSYFYFHKVLSVNLVCVVLVPIINHACVNLIYFQVWLR